VNLRSCSKKGLITCRRSDTVMHMLTWEKRALVKVICVGYYWLHEEQIRRKLQARVVRLLSWHIAQCHHCLGIE
jgi:hypothetical protein